MAKVRGTVRLQDNLVPVVGGITRDTGRALATQIRTRASETAPLGRPPRSQWRAERSSRQGNLRRSHNNRRAQPAGRLRFTFTVENSAPYALFVHEGTDFISGPTFWWSADPRYRDDTNIPSGLPGTWAFAEGNRGQEKQPWLRDAAFEVVATSPLVRAGGAGFAARRLS